MPGRGDELEGPPTRVTAATLSPGAGSRIGRRSRPRPGVDSAPGMHLKGCLHTHTTCSDGKMTPQEVADAYERLGYDFLAFTDHDHLWRPDQEARYDAVRSGLLLLRGVELTVFERGYLHVNRIRGESETLHVLNHLGDYDLEVGEVLERIGALAARYPLDAVEVTSKGFLRREFEVPEIRYPKLATDDAHEPIHVGRAWIELEAARESDAILRAVKHGDFWNCYAKGAAS